ncbi:MAG: hypothetical protein AAFU67_11085 [Bacteroidota bacterium]
MHATKKVFADGRSYLTVLDSPAYSQPLACLSGTTVGQHSRHWIEFFQCLFGQLEDGKEAICYDLRKRDYSLETEPDAALAALDELIDLSENLTNDRSLQLTTTIGQEESTFLTSLSREWWYAIEHAIHHLAIIKIALSQAFPTVELPHDFGLAYSTKQFRAAQMK